MNNKQTDIKKIITRKGYFVRIPIPYKMKELEPEITLGRSILDRAFLDCFEDPKEKLWFTLTNEDFDTICFISHLEPEKVKHQVSVTLLNYK